VHDPPGLEVRGDLFDDVADLVDLLIELLLPIQEFAPPGFLNLIVKVDRTVTILELEEGLPDEARLALLDLDIEAQAIRGHRLTWNAEAEAWVPTDMQD